MPLTIPTLDDRKYDDLVQEALARIPVHTPEWTNFNESDPGVTLIELFAFLTENLLYRSNQIPERSRRKFLSLLNISLQPASAAQGIVTFSNERGPLQSFTLNSDLEVLAGKVSFRTELGLDVLPIEAHVFYKRELKNPPQQLLDYYNQLYASYLSQQLPESARLYETVPFPHKDMTAVNLGEEAIDGSLWIALVVRAGDTPYDQQIHSARDQIGGKTLNLGIVPSLTDAGLRLAPGEADHSDRKTPLNYEVPVGGTLPVEPDMRDPEYSLLEASASTDLLTVPGIVQIKLPAAEKLKLWDNLDPLETGVGDFPPTLEDTILNDRIITWLRVRPSVALGVRLLWAGINAVNVSQRIHVSGELLPAGTGAPDQTTILTKRPVIPESIRLTVTSMGESQEWQRIDDLTVAGPEVPVRDPRNPPGTPPVNNDLVNVFTLDPESGKITFGDGLRGARPPLNAVLRVDYDYALGREGNVNAGAVSGGPMLPSGIKVSNPVPTWGGAEAETITQGEKQIARYLQHRDRLVTVGDFETIIHRTPGVDIGRLDVIPTFNPELAPNEPGDAPGAVTVMVIPKYDSAQPDAPRPDRLFLDTICRYINSRRLVTTEVFLRGPIYKDIWISVGINVVAGKSVAEVREAVKFELLQFLSPLPSDGSGWTESPVALAATAQEVVLQQGWPLRKPVVDLELLTVAVRVKDVQLVNKVLLAEGDKAAAGEVKMAGLELPRVRGISVSVGEPLGLEMLRGRKTTPAIPGLSEDDGAQPPQLIPVPVIPEKCK